MNACDGDCGQKATTDQGLDSGQVNEEKSKREEEKMEGSLVEFVWMQS